MALIKKSKTPEGSGYENIIGKNELSILITRIHATKISSGTELEKLLFEAAPYKLTAGDVDEAVGDADKYIKETPECAKPKRVYMIDKKTMKKSSILKSKTEPDFLGLDFANKILHIIEVKDGENFDTKKSAVEHENLEKYSTFISKKVAFKSFVSICLFNTKDKEKALKEGLKSKFKKEQIITGQEFCDIFGIGFDAIIAKRESDINANLEFLKEEVKKWLENSEKGADRA